MFALHALATTVPGAVRNTNCVAADAPMVHAALPVAAGAAEVATTVVGPLWVEVA
jgi:hypothetical protein